MGNRELVVERPCLLNSCRGVTSKIVSDTWNNIVGTKFLH
jgi:hypothetical protein